ncbi:beta-galactosidase [Paenibacillus humicola]|uniref:beta-galactosidase n=1 Tax=Paenibacillus humicola TaxID=3110540 RepID=UPI00237AC1CA|nr:beta-galactosidase [Paenibacillus humicola]
MSMHLKAASASQVELTPDALRIDGRSEIVLCASLFYFRIPRALWRERMEQTKAFGYNAIDVYFPWNFHELREGEWSFEGERDADAFLRLAAEAGLWVVARPGPYICSEWDGGALPAYLLAKERMKLRDNDPAFLQAVSRWYDRILPVLKRHELGGADGGTVIALQLENELDFYGCADPLGYISALRDMALASGITVPLIACAGQGGLYEASGFADGVAPACNFYPNDRDPEFERKVAAYGSRLEARGLPLLVTETNRSHFLLRRLLSCGTKLIGPYLQVSGTDFGFTNATNNWGKPLAFMTSDYDFRGMISPEGHIRDEAYEGRLLRRVIETYGSALAEAKPARRRDDGTGGSPPANAAVRQTLELAGGGRLLFVSNVGEREETLAVSFRGRAEPAAVSIAPMRCAILPEEVPLRLWGLEGTLQYASAELACVAMAASRTVMVFHAERGGEIALRFGTPPHVLDADGMEVRIEGSGAALTFAGGRRSGCTLELAGGGRLTLLVTTRAEMLLFRGIDETGSILLEQKIEADVAPRTEEGTVWSIGRIDPLRPIGSGAGVPLPAADYLERQGVYRGFAWYEAAWRLPPGSALQGVLLQNAGDVLSVYEGGRFLGTIVPGGGSRFVPAGSGDGAGRDAPAASAGAGTAAPKETAAPGAADLSAGGPEGSRFAEPPRGGSLIVRTEIWGHSNFDDVRLPGLRLHALKGLTGAAAVTNVRNLSSNWRMRRAGAGSHELDPQLAAPGLDDGEWPVVGFGGWMSANYPDPALECYRRSFETSAEADSWTLHFKGIQAQARVYVDGCDAGPVHPNDPHVDITRFVEAGRTVQVAVFLERAAGRQAGAVLLYEGVRADEWRLSAAEEPELLTAAEAARARAERTELPVTLAPGTAAWLYGQLQPPPEGGGWRMRAAGSGMKLTVFFAGRLVSRLWLPGGEERPVVTGGSSDSFWLPGPWFGEGGAGGREGTLAILLEAVVPDAPAVLNGFTYHPAGGPASGAGNEEASG